VDLFHRDLPPKFWTGIYVSFWCHTFHIYFRYPQIDYPDSSLPPSIALVSFCYFCKSMSYIYIVLFSSLHIFIFSSGSTYIFHIRFNRRERKRIIWRGTDISWRNEAPREIWQLWFVLNIAFCVLWCDTGFVLDREYFSPKCLCVVSRHPIYDTVRSFLHQLYRITVSPSDIPIEVCPSHKSCPMRNLFIAIYWQFLSRCVGSTSWRRRCIVSYWTRKH